MVKILIKYLAKFGNIPLYCLTIILAGIIIILGWLNHLDFERSIIKVELRELLIIAKSASNGIEGNLVRIKQEPQYIDQLIQHINNEGSFISFVMDNRHIILNDPVQRYIGKNIFMIGEGILNTQELLQLDGFIKKLDFNDSGTATLMFPSQDIPPRKEMRLFAFSRAQTDGRIYYVIVTEGLSALTAPLHRNLRDILILVGLFFLVLSAFGYIFYRIQKKRLESETTSRALEIINKQLHCEINDYKYVEKSPKKPKNSRK